MINNVLVEVCCGGINDCLTAIKCNADRIELNSALEMGGLTPSVSVLREVKKHTDIPICCMVRPRGYGFCYSEEEYQLMKQDAKLLLENGADGIVFGFLHEDGSLDEERTREFVTVIKPKQAVFHKAFDHIENKDEAILKLIDCGVDRILTSGGAVYPDIEEGLQVMHKYNSLYGDKITILPGGGVRSHNAVEILEKTGCHQIHMTAKELKLDRSTYEDGKDPKDYSYVAVSETNLKEIMNEIKKAKID